MRAQSGVKRHCGGPVFDFYTITDLGARKLSGMRARPLDTRTLAALHPYATLRIDSKQRSEGRGLAGQPRLTRPYWMHRDETYLPAEAVQWIVNSPDFENLNMPKEPDPRPLTSAGNGSFAKIDLCEPDNTKLLSSGSLNRPGNPGGSRPWKRGWSHAERTGAWKADVASV